MDRNTFTGFFLILVILVGSMYFLKPSEAELKKEQLVQDSIKNAKEGKVATKKQSVATPVTPVIDSALLKGPFGSARTGNNEVVVLENAEMKVSISNKGGRIESVELKKYKTYDKKPLILFTGDDSSFGLSFNAGGATINTKDLYFTPSAKNLVVAKSDSASITFRAA